MNERTTSGPYRATLLWNGLIRTFRSDIQLGRHRRYMKTYDDCFVASEAVDWLHQYLKENPNFGADISRAQSIKLLQKLHKAHVFEDVRGQKHDRGEFTDSSRLFRLTICSPSKGTRTPIALKNNLKLANLNRSPLTRTTSDPTQVKLDFEKMSSMPSLPDNTSTLPECHFMSKPLTSEEIEEEWKKMTLQSIQSVLGVESINDIIEYRYIRGRYIMHNCLYVNKSGVVTNIQPNEQLPHWALSAMKYLAYWPDKTDTDLPNYPGFEKDVFRIVKDYFCELPEPLMTFNMYEVITNIFVRSFKKTHHCSNAQLPSNSEFSNSTPKSLRIFQSAENLLMSLSKVSKHFAECQDASEGYSSTNILDLSPIQPINLSNSHENDQNPVTRYETAFGPDNKTVTRVIYADGIATDFNHIRSGCTEGTQTPVETHFEHSLSEEPKTFSRKNSLRHSMHNLFNRSSGKKEKKHKYEKNSSRRKSTGVNLNDEGSYGCTVGVYSKTSPNSSSSSSSLSYTSPTSRPMPVTRSGSMVVQKGVEKYRRSSSGSKPPPHSMNPSHDALCPDSLYPQTLQPVINGYKKTVKRKKSMSSNSLHQRRSFIDSHDYGGKNCTSILEKNQSKACVNEVNVGRSLSMSDLAAAPPPVENELQKQCKGNIEDSKDSLCIDDSTERIIKALQLVCLLLPPANRRRLHLLLRLMNKMSTNQKLSLDGTQSTRTLLLETFYRAILCCQDESDMDDLLVIQLVAFLMDHYTEIFAVPNDLKTKVELHLAKLQRTKIRYAADDTSTLHYCKQISLDEYENQRMTASQQALASLLEEIVNDESMNLKERKKRLKQFQKMYPDIYNRRFPLSRSEAELYPSRPHIKQQLLTKPLLKLKGLRL